MNRSTPGLPVQHQLLEFTRTHVHWVGDAIQSSHPLSSPFSSCLQSFPTSGSFKWVSSSHQVAKILEFQLQHQSFQWTPRTDFLSDGLVGSPCRARDSQESSPTPQFKSTSYYKSSNMMLLKCCTQYVSKFGKLSSGHRTGKGKFSFQYQRKAMPKNVQTTAQLHSSHTLVK